MKDEERAANVVNDNNIHEHIPEVQVNVENSNAAITQTDKNQSSEARKETTRSFIARLYVWGFFIVVGLVFVIGALKCFSVDNYKDMLVTVSGILSGPLGFIVGYYFKASTE